MKAQIQRFNERFLDNVFSFEDLLRTLNNVAEYQSFTNYEDT